MLSVENVRHEHYFIYFHPYKVLIDYINYRGISGLLANNKETFIDIKPMSKYMSKNDYFQLYS